MQTVISASKESLSTINPIRQCTEHHFVDAVKKCEKELLKIATGKLSMDPCDFTGGRLGARENFRVRARGG